MDNIQIDSRNVSGRNPAARLHIRRSQHSHPMSLAALYLLTRPSVFSYAFKITRSREAAEEVAQDVYTYAWLNTDSYDNTRGDLICWLLMLCRSRSIDYLRSDRLRSAHEVWGADMDFIDGEFAGPELSHIAASQSLALHLSMKSLSPIQRQMLVLCYFSEIPHAEIAVLMDMPLGTVKTTIRRAKQSLAAHPLLHRGSESA